MNRQSELSVDRHQGDPRKADRPGVATNRGRKIRARVVTLARRYRAACAAYEETYAGVELGTGSRAAWDEAAEAMDQARNAVFSALDELEIQEGGTGV